MPNKKQTSKKVAKIASKLLRKSKDPAVKKVAASALSQTKPKRK